MMSPDAKVAGLLPNIPLLADPIEVIEGLRNCIENGLPVQNRCGLKRLNPPEGILQLGFPVEQHNHVDEGLGCLPLLLLLTKLLYYDC